MVSNLNDVWEFSQYFSILIWRRLPSSKYFIFFNWAETSIWTNYPPTNWQQKLAPKRWWLEDKCFRLLQLFVSGSVGLLGLRALWYKLKRVHISFSQSVGLLDSWLDSLFVAYRTLGVLLVHLVPNFNLELLQSIHISWIRNCLELMTLVVKRLSPLLVACYWSTTD